MSSLRLFIAIRIPEEVIADWPQVQIKLKKEIKKYDFDVKWTLPGSYHVNLVFLGQTSEEKIPSLQNLLSSVAAKYPPFKLNINGMGAFADILHARILYLGVQNKKILRALQEDIIQLLKDGEANRTLPSEAEGTEYVPHLTVLRFRNAHAVKELISPFLRKKWGDVEVTELILYKSELRGLYPIYTPIFKVSLTGSQSESSE
jgi:2'-5' RNA ligase